DTDEAGPAKVEEVIEIVTAAKLMTKVVTIAATTITSAQVPKASSPRRRRGVIIQDPEEAAIASVIGRLSYARAMIKLQPDVELKDTIIVAMPKLLDVCPKNIGSDVAKNLKTQSQAPRGVLVSPKKKDVELRKEVSNPNPFDVLNSVENNVDLGTNGRTSNLASKETNSSGFSSWNVDYPGDHDSEDEVEPVHNKMASFMASERVGFGDHDSEDEVEPVHIGTKEENL
nr:hypothetical protein [Tanacetum cinerariifolium]